MAVSHKLEMGFDKLLRKIGRWTDAGVQNAVPNLLHHYTTIAGVTGIIQNAEIWATKAEFLNDESELIYGQAMVEEALQKLRRTRKSAWANSFVSMAKFVDPYELLYPKPRRRKNNLDTYVACFCGTSDLLSQWRGYGSSGGYSLDIRGVKLVSAAHNLANTSLVRVIYSRIEQEKLVAKFVAQFIDIVGKAFDGVSSLPNKPDPNDPAFQLFRQCLFTFRDFCELLLPAFKSDRFSEENEWRIVHQKQSDDLEGVRFRIAGDALCPYVAIPININDDIIQTITCGPSSRRSPAALALQAYCRQMLPKASVLTTSVTLKI